jgi:ComF family protein
VCASPSPQGLPCGACLGRAPAFAATIAACRYAFPVDRLVHALKYGHRLALAEPLGDALAAAVLRAPPSYRSPEAIVALPLAAARQRERGFNQAIELARVVARRTALPLAGGLVRTSASPPQASLRWPERRRNVRGAFGCTRAFTGQRVAIVDDVMTSGATLDAAASALRKAGASEVHAWVVARTLQA